jgi:hypothetical protein
MIVRVEQGKVEKARYTILSPRLLKRQEGSSICWNPLVAPSRQGILCKFFPLAGQMVAFLKLSSVAILSPLVFSLMSGFSPQRDQTYRGFA